MKKKIIIYLLFLTIFVISCDEEKEDNKNDLELVEKILEVSNNWIEPNKSYLYNYETYYQNNLDEISFYSNNIEFYTLDTFLFDNKVIQEYYFDNYFEFNSGSNLMFDSNYIISKQGFVFLFDSVYSLIESNDTICRFDLDKWIVSKPIILEEKNNSILYLLKEAEFLQDSIFYFNDRPVLSKTVEIKHFKIKEENSKVIEKVLDKKEIFNFTKNHGIIHYKIENLNLNFDSNVEYTDDKLVSFETFLIHIENLR